MAWLKTKMAGESKLMSNHRLYEACPENKDTRVLNMYNIFNLQKRHREWIACA